MHKAVLSLILFLSSPAAFPAANLITKSQTCAETSNVTMVKSFDPAKEYGSSDIQKISNLVKECPGFKLPQETKEAISRKLKESQFKVAREAFESLNPNFGWDFLLEKAKAAGHSENQLQAMMKPFLDQAKSDCAPRDQRAKLPEVWNQGNQGWCYGYAAAGMASYILQEPVSPDAVSFRYSLDNTWNGGNTQEALEISQQKGFCRADKMAFSQDLQDQGYEPIFNSGYLINELANEFFDGRGRRIANITDDIVCRNALTPMALDLAASLKLNATELAYILQKASGENMVKRYAEEDCVAPSKKLDVKFHSIIVIDPKNPIQVASYEKDAAYPKNSAEEARRQLQQAIRDDKVVGVGTFDNSVIGAGDRNHAMVVIGQSWNDKTQQCNVLIRNSWGGCLPGADEDSICDGKGNYSVPIGKILKHRTTFTLY